MLEYYFLKKKQIVERIIGKENLTSRASYFKQYSIFNFLLKTFPDPNFWSTVNFGEGITSLYFFRTSQGNKLLTSKYKEFKFKPKQKKPPKIFDKSFGDDKILHRKANTIRKFLK